MHENMDVIKEADELMHYRNEYEDKKRTFIAQLKAQLVSQIDNAYKKQLRSLEVAENLILSSLPVEVLQMKAANLKAHDFDLVELMAKNRVVDERQNIRKGKETNKCLSAKNKNKIRSERKIQHVVTSSKKPLSPPANRHLSPNRNLALTGSKAKSQPRFDSRVKTGNQTWRI